MIENILIRQKLNPSEVSKQQFKKYLQDVEFHIKYFRNDINTKQHLDTFKLPHELRELKNWVSNNIQSNIQSIEYSLNIFLQNTYLSEIETELFNKKTIQLINKLTKSMIYYMFKINQYLDGKFSISLN